MQDCGTEGVHSPGRSQAVVFHVTGSGAPATLSAPVYPRASAESQRTMVGFTLSSAPLCVDAMVLFFVQESLLSLSGLGILYGW